jgi:site-specific DNA-methyltransferase (adenine-specific)
MTSILLQGDAFLLMRDLEPGSIDCVVSDLPYASLEAHRSVGTTTRLKSWFPTFGPERYPEVAALLWRALRQDSHTYLFASHQELEPMRAAMCGAGFRFWKPLVWDKIHIGMGYHYRARYEFILFFEKGKRRLANLGQADVIPWPRIARGYPTEKPTKVIDVLLAQSTLPGETVLDPFCGSGSTLVSAAQMGRGFVGFDSQATAIEAARTRLAKVASPTQIPLF